MAQAALERDYEYIAITDHAKGLKITGGIDEVQLAEQAAEIAAVNRTLEEDGRELRALRSIELNLNPRRRSRYGRGRARGLDIVIPRCFHSSLRRKDDQTERYLVALRNPAIQILGHPRGRIYNFCSGLTADWPRSLRWRRKRWR